MQSNRAPEKKENENGDGYPRQTGEYDGDDPCSTYYVTYVAFATIFGFLALKLVGVYWYVFECALTPSVSPV